MSDARRNRLFQAPNPNIQAPEKLQLPITNHRRQQIELLVLEVSLDVVSLEFGTYEIVLARETGTILVFVVRLCRRRSDQLDRGTQLHCPK